MGTAWVTGYRSRGNNGYPCLPPNEVLPSAITSTGVVLNAGALTQLIDICSDVGAWLLVTSSTSAVVATATNSIRIPAGAAPKTYDIAPYSRLSILST